MKKFYSLLIPSEERIFIKIKKIFLILVLGIFYQESNAQVVGPGDWSSVRLYGHAYNTSGFSTDEYDWIANHNYFFTIEKRHANLIYGNPSSEYASGVAATQIKTNNSTCRPLFYWNSSVIYNTIYQTIEDVLAIHPTWARSDEKWDYTATGFPEWWVSVAQNQVNNSAEEGVFVDAVPNVEAVQGATALAKLHTMLDQLPGFVIYNGFYTTGAGGLLAGLSTLEHADGVYVESFMQGNCNTPARGKQLLDCMLLIPPDKYFVTNCSANTDWNSTDHQFSLACYLIVANDYSFYRYSSTGYGPGNLMLWDEDFGKYIGQPTGTGKATVNGYVYTRTFANASVTVDLLNKTSSIIWGPLLTVSDFENHHLNIFPNPVQDTLNITLIEDAFAEIVDAQGKNIYNNYLKKGANLIPMGAFSSGIYFLQLTTKSAVKKQKLIKQ
jgi:hypothetical protein